MAAGAIPVEARVLVRKLIASGLRIPARQRGKALKVPLLNRWNAVLPGHDALFLDLLDRWGEEHRKYHGRTHLLSVLEALDLLDRTCRTAPHRSPCGAGSTTLCTAASPARTRRNQPGSPRTGSCMRACPKTRRTRWGGWSGSLRTTGRMPGTTTAPSSATRTFPCSAANQRPTAATSAAVREDFAHIGDADFAAGRAAVVRHLLDLDPLFNTPRGRELWLDSARRNLSGELNPEDRPA